MICFLVPQSLSCSEEVALGEGTVPGVLVPPCHLLPWERRGCFPVAALNCAPNRSAVFHRLNPPLWLISFYNMKVGNLLPQI